MIERLGIVEEGIRRREFYHGAKPVAVPRPVLRVTRPIYEKGRYIPMSLSNIIAVVARIAQTDEAAICGMGRRRGLVDCRFAIANLAEEFAPMQSAAALDDAMLRGTNMCMWYRERHSDRIAAFPEYAALYARCREEMLQRRKTGSQNGAGAP